MPLADTPSPVSPRWLHFWAVATVCATFVLLTLGAVVTTFNFGMADRIWPTYPWHLALIDWTEPKPGFLIEHSHRLAGYVVGCCVIVLAVGLWITERRHWLCWLGTAALVLVIIQGLLGGFRVKLDAVLGPWLKLIHGCFSQVVFGLLVSLAVFTSRGWSRRPEAASAGAGTWRLRWLSTALAGLIYVQIVFGAILRHTYSPLGQRGHLLLAFVVVAAVAWLVRESLASNSRARHWPRGVLLLAGLAAVQVVLGVEAWMVRFLAYSAPGQQALVRTAHVLTGYLLFGTAVAVAVRAYPRPAQEGGAVAASLHHLEGAA